MRVYVNMTENVNSNGNKWLECCKGYRYLQGKCEKCPPGKYSYNCERDCPNSFYGVGCIYKCNCKEDEFCNPVFGCLCQNCTETENKTENMTTQESNTGTDIKLPIVFFIGLPCAVAVVILIIMTVFGIRKIRHKIRDSNINDPRNINPNTERPYDYIDENILDNICRDKEACTNDLHATSFIQSKNNTENSERSSMNSIAVEQQSGVCIDGYLNPYSSLHTEMKPVPYDVPFETSTVCDIPTKSKHSYDIPKTST